MVIEKITGDIFETDSRHIAFAVNVEGINDSGFAGLVTIEIWPEMRYTKVLKLGEAYRHETDDKTYWALVCHSLLENGWEDAPSHLKKCIDEMEVPESEPIAIVKVGAGPVGRAMGADVMALHVAMSASNKRLRVYSLDGS
jgi:hypothetical protein